MNSPQRRYRIGLDASCLHRYGVGGMETYINNLIKELQIINHPKLEIIRLEGPPSLKKPTPYAPVAFLKELLWIHWQVNIEAKRQHLDLIHMPAHLHAPWCKTPQIVTLHDAHVYIAPGTHPLPIAIYIKVFSWLAGKQKRVKLVVTPSENAKQDLIRYHHIPAQKITVAHLGSRRFPPAAGTHPHPEWMPYLFYLGVMKPHKNLLRLLEVFKKLLDQPDLSSYHLVIGGPYFGADYPILLQRIPQLKLQERVHLIGPQPDEQLSHWYGQASLAILPSINEGFGHLPIEAMQFGTPTVVSKVGAIPEIVGNAAEFIEDPINPESIYSAIIHVLRQPERRQELSRFGKERSAEFTWRRHAEHMVDIYLSILESHE